MINKLYKVCQRSPPCRPCTIASNLDFVCTAQHAQGLDPVVVMSLCMEFLLVKFQEMYCHIPSGHCSYLCKLVMIPVREAISSTSCPTHQRALAAYGSREENALGDFERFGCWSRSGIHAVCLLCRQNRHQHHHNSSCKCR